MQVVFKSNIFVSFLLCVCVWCIGNLACVIKYNKQTGSTFDLINKQVI